MRIAYLMSTILQHLIKALIIILITRYKSFFIKELNTKIDQAFLIALFSFGGGGWGGYLWGILGDSGSTEILGLGEVFRLVWFFVLLCLFACLFCFWIWTLFLSDCCNPFFHFFPLIFLQSHTNQYFFYKTYLAQVSCVDWFPDCWTPLWCFANWNRGYLVEDVLHRSRSTHLLGWWECEMFKLCSKA